MDEKQVNRIIGANIRRLRAARSMSQTGLAERLQVTKQRLSALENGKVGLGKALLIRLCSLFDVRPCEFFLENDTPVVRDEAERQLLDNFRAARSMGIAGEIQRYMTFALAESRIKSIENKIKEAGLGNEEKRD